MVKVVVSLRGYPTFAGLQRYTQGLAEKNNVQRNFAIFFWVYKFMVYEFSIAWVINHKLINQ